jgi:hypothetical protein
MNFPGFLFIPIATLGPFVLLVIYQRIRLVYKRRANRALEESGRELPVLFEPKDEPAPGFFLRRFTFPQRTYLREQRSAARMYYIICAWVMFVFLSSSLLPREIERFDAEFSHSQRVWFSYLRGLGLMIIMVAFFSLMTSIITTSYLQEPRLGTYIRTRPLTRKFLFWARIGSALATLLAAILSGALGSLLLMLIVYGPVWTSLADSTWRGTVAFGNSQQTHHLYHVIQLVLTSMPRLMLSLLTTAALIFSFFAVLNTLSKSTVRNAYLLAFSLAIYFGVIEAQRLTSSLAAHRALGLSIAHCKEVLFLYFSLGPPPPWFYAFIPIFLSAVFLWLAQIFFARKEL